MTIEVETKMMGKVSVDEDHFISIPSGLFGFEEYVDFALIESEYKPFIWLQSLQDKNLAFLLIDPFIIDSDYEAEIDDSELSPIGVKEPRDVIVMCIVTVPNDGSAITANFQGPLIINKKNKLCMQVVLNSSRYTTKHNILQALKTKEEK